MKKLLALVAVFAMLVGFAAAYALPSVDTIKINGNTFSSGDQLVVSRGDTLDITVKLSAVSNESNIDVEAEVLGYEHSDVQPLIDRTGVFDMLAGDTVYKHLTITLPNLMEKDYYDLRIRVGTRTGNSTEYLFRLRLSGKRHNLQVKDITYNPSQYVLSGTAFLAQVRVWNLGDKPERDVKVVLGIPELGISASDYISVINPDESVSTGDLFIRVPQCVTSGTYTLRAEVTYNDGYSTTVYTTPITVKQDDTLCAANESGRIVAVVSAPGTLTEGTEGTIAIVLTNEGKKARTVVLSLAGSDGWAQVSFEPAPVVLVPGEGSATIYAKLRPLSGSAGAHALALQVADLDGKQVAQAAFTVSISQPEAPAPTTPPEAGYKAWSLKQWLEASLLVLIIVLVILGIVLILKKNRKTNGDGEVQAYY